MDFEGERDFSSIALNMDTDISHPISMRASNPDDLVPEIWFVFLRTCKSLILVFYLHVYIIMMNFYAGFSRCGCIFIHDFPLPSPLGEIMWYLQPFFCWKNLWNDIGPMKCVNLTRYFEIYTFGGEISG